MCDTKTNFIVCARCLQEEYKNDIEYHRVISLANGGSNKINNLIPLCKDCDNEWTFVKAYGMEFNNFLDSLTQKELTLKQMIFNDFKEVETFKDLPKDKLDEIIERNIRDNRVNLNKIAFKCP